MSSVVSFFFLASFINIFRSEGAFVATFDDDDAVKRSSTPSQVSEHKNKKSGLPHIVIAM